jgi:FAD synthetase
MSEVNEDPASRTQRYLKIIQSTLENQKFKNTDHEVQSGDIQKVLDTIHRYIKDAHYYLEHGKATTALASVAYAEGLLDALKFLELSETT